MKLSRIATFAAVAGLLALAVWLLLPSRNVHGNPEVESLLSSCETTDAVTARLYEGNGGATTSFWYTVTLEGKALGSEKQVFFAYATPSVERLACQGADVVLGGDGFKEVLPARAFAALRNAPIEIWRGKRGEGGVQPKTIISWLLAAAAIVAAAVLLFRRAAAWRRGRKRTTV